MKLKLKVKGKIMPVFDTSEYYVDVSTTPNSHSLTDAVGTSTETTVHWEHSPHRVVDTIGNGDYNDESELNDILKELDKIRIKQGVSFKKCKSFMNIE